MKSNLLISILLLVIALHAKSMEYSTIDVVMNLNRDNTISVVEKQSLVLTGAWNGVHRGFNRKGCDSIVIDSVFINNQLSPQGDINRKGNHAIIESKDNVMMRLRSRGVNDPDYAYDTLQITIKYTIFDAIAHYSEYDELRWKPLFDQEKNSAIMRARVKITVPEGASIQNIELYTKSSEAQWAYENDYTHTVIITSPHVTIDPLEFAFRIEGNAFNPSRSENNYHYYNVKPYIFPVSLGGVLLLLSIFWLYWGRDPHLGRDPREQSKILKSISIKDLSPGLVGLIIDERFDTQDTLATIIDLAQRKYIAIEHNEDEQAVGYPNSYLFKCIMKPAEGDTLLPLDKKLLVLLFGESLTPGSTIDSKDVKDRFKIIHESLREVAWQEAVSLKWFDIVPKQRRALFFKVGACISIVGAVYAGKYNLEVFAALLFGSLICYLPGFYWIKEYRRIGWSALKKANHVALFSLSGFVFILLGSFYDYHSNHIKVDFGIALFFIGFVICCFSPFTGKKSVLGANVKVKVLVFKEALIKNKVPTDIGPYAVLPWLLALGVGRGTHKYFSKLLINEEDFVENTGLCLSLARCYAPPVEGEKFPLQNSIPDMFNNLNDVVGGAALSGYVASSSGGSN